MVKTMDNKSVKETREKVNLKQETYRTDSCHLERNEGKQNSTETCLLNTNRK